MVIWRQGQILVQQIRIQDNSVDDVPIPDLFDIGCSKSYNSEKNFSNDRFEKETGRCWSDDENSDVNTSNSDDNENVPLENETGPNFVKVHPLFGRPAGEMCEDKRFNEIELKIKNQIFSASIYLQNITRILGQ